MKKALSLFLAGLMVASLAACGNNAESQPATDENKTVADQSDMAAPQEIEEGTPVYADVLNDGTYGLSGRDGVLWLSLLRSPAYTAHPIGERRIIPQDRYSPQIEQGERLYRFCLLAGDAAQVLPGTARRADAFGERPMALSFFPAGEANARPLDALLQLTGDDAVQLPAVKRAADGRGLIVRLFNPTAAPRTAVLQGAPLAAPLSVAFGPFEIVTLRLLEGEACRCDLLEQSLDEQNG